MTSRNENRASKRLILAYKAYGHAFKGKGKRGASKARRKVGKAIVRDARVSAR
jgi:hypothetical protein